MYQISCKPVVVLGKELKRRTDGRTRPTDYPPFYTFYAAMQIIWTTLSFCQGAMFSEFIFVYPFNKLYLNVYILITNLMH